MMNLEAPAVSADLTQSLARWRGRSAPAAARHGPNPLAAGLAAPGKPANAGEPERRLQQAPQGTPARGAEVQLRRADGELRWVALSTRVVRQGNGGRVVVSVLDVSEVHDLRQRQQAALAELARVQADLLRLRPMATLGMMAEGIARDVEPDLQAGLQMAGDLAEQARLAGALAQAGMRRGELRAFVESARYASSRITPAMLRAGGLVGSVKQLAVDQGNGVRRRFQLAALVNDVVSAAGSALALPGHWALVNVPDALWLDSYPGALGQVLMQLMDNAARHGSRGTERGMLTLTGWRSAPGKVALELRDAGRGISAKQLADAWTPAGEPGASHAGLGLRLARDLTECVLRGRLELHGRPESGTRATLTLPCEA